MKELILKALTEDALESLVQDAAVEALQEGAQDGSA